MDNQHHEEDVIICNSNDMGRKWEEVFVTGRVPVPRHAHASAVCGDSMYVYGGYSKLIHLDDFFRFDFKLNKWFRILKNEKPKETSSPPPSLNTSNSTTTTTTTTATTPTIIPIKTPIITARHSHSMVSFNEFIYIYGGIGSNKDSDANVYSDLYEYNTIKDEWKLIKSAENEFQPEPRWGHSAVVYNDTMIIFGGMGQSVSFYSTILVFNFTTKLWSRMIVKNSVSSINAVTAANNNNTTGNVMTPPVIPRGRHYHTSSIINDKLYIFGGYDGAVCPNDMYEFNLITLIWSIIPGPHKIVRCGTSVTFNNKIYLFGGRNKIVFNSIHEFDPSTYQWREIHSNSSLNVKPSPRQYSSSVLYNNQMYIFGGQSDYNENDIFKFNFNYNDNNNNNVDGNGKGIFNSLFENRETMFSDIKFIVQDKIIHANKCILVSRNEKLRALITNGMQESRMDTIKIDNCSFNVFETILRFIYTDILYFNNLNILELLLISDQYMINEIKVKCCEYVSKLLLKTPISEIYHNIIEQTLSITTTTTTKTTTS